MNGNSGMYRTPLDVAFFVVCFVAVITIAAGLIVGSVWTTVG